VFSELNSYLTNLNKYDGYHFQTENNLFNISSKEVSVSLKKINNIVPVILTHRK
jgi:hypothetical protein